MTHNIPTFVTLLAQDRVADARNTLTAELSDRVMGALSAAKQDLASSLFGGEKALQESEDSEEDPDSLDEWKSIKGVDLDKVRADAKKKGKRVALQHGEHDSLYKVVKEEIEDLQEAVVTRDTFSKMLLKKKHRIGYRGTSRHHSDHISTRKVGNSGHILSHKPTGTYTHGKWEVVAPNKIKVTPHKTTFYEEAIKEETEQ